MHLANRADIPPALLDALGADHGARSMAELALSPGFTREHDNLYFTFR